MNAHTKPIDKIILHTLYTPPEMDVTAEDVYNWHTQGNGWLHGGYHWVIGRSGLIESLRPAIYQGAHTRGHNDGSLGVALAGGKLAANVDEPENNYTMAQWLSVDALLNAIVSVFGPLEIYGHNDFNSDRWCPGFNAKLLIERKEN